MFVITWVPEDSSSIRSPGIGVQIMRILRTKPWFSGKTAMLLPAEPSFQYLANSSCLVLCNSLIKSKAIIIALNYMLNSIAEKFEWLVGKIQE